MRCTLGFSMLIAPTVPTGAAIVYVQLDKGYAKAQPQFFRSKQIRLFYKGNIVQLH